MNVKQVLLSAADILERDGWCQGIVRNRNGQRCAWGAIMAAAAPDQDAALGYGLVSYTDWPPLAIAAAAAMVGESLAYLNEEEETYAATKLTDWNDGLLSNEGRHVIDRIRSVAANLEES